MQNRGAVDAGATLPGLVGPGSNRIIDAMARVTIIVRKDNAYRVEDPEGLVELVDGEGHRFDLAGRSAFSLCRCGASATRPFCDGAHKRIGFQAAESALKIE
jgi:CDGSH-type Zn-finger protein